jgi:hypothetical protein
MQKHTLWLPVLLLVVLAAVSSCSESKADMAPNANNGVGGSLARFAIVDNYLYTVSNSTLKVFDISQAQQPRQMNSVKLGLNIETIFPYNNMLFIGSRTGMHIYDNANPTQPVLLSQYQHVQSCDPVVVQGNYAYVTLRDGTECRFGQNVLDVVNISNPRSPSRVQSIPMLNPHGLGIDGNVLFVCEGDHGLKVFDVTNPAQPIEKQFIKGIRTYDVIPHKNVMLVVGKDGLMQYDYSDVNNPRLLSMIPLAN